jgi:5'-methylthioadenosine phosphorylase
MDRTVGIIGGSGLYRIPGFETDRTVMEETPFGNPSGPVVLGSFGGVPVAFIARHGEGHVYMPSDVPYAANIYALKSLGVRTVIAVSAVGSLQQQIEPRHFVVPDQLLDRTKGVRRCTFYGDGIVSHSSFGEPFCDCVRGVLIESCREAGAAVHPGGTLVVMEGPAFSTRAESFLYRSMGASVIGMTALPEAKLAREAGICYAILAMSTDYDVWHEYEEDVTIETVLANVQANVDNARTILGIALGKLGSMDLSGCGCCAGSDTVMTAPEKRNPEKMMELRVVLER